MLYHDLLEQVGHDTAFMMVLDRDYRDESSAQNLAQKYKNNVFMWSCHELENLLISPDIIWEVLKNNDAANTFDSAEAVQRAMLETARALKSQFALEWATYRLHLTFSTHNS